MVIQKAVRFLIGFGLITQLFFSINAVIDPISIAVGVIFDKTIQYSCEWLFAQSTTKAEYLKRHQLLEKQTKSFFLSALELAKSAQGSDFTLSQYELYRYPNFIQALKEFCPEEYATYIKALFIELINNPKKSEVQGFVTRHLIVSAGCGVRSINLGTYYEFFELIKILYIELVEQEIMQQQAFHNDAIKNVIEVQTCEKQQADVMEQLNLE